MNKYIVHVKMLFFLVGGILLSYAQMQGDVDQSQSIYKAVGVNCGHVLDGPSFYFKQLENKSLDNMFTVSQRQKKEIGKKNNELVLKKYKLATEFPNKKAVFETFENLEKQSNNPIQLKLYVLESDEVNAFTMLGGYVYLTTGLLSYVDSMDELAFILGHEIGHNEKLHVERKIKKVMATSKAMNVVGADAFSKVAIDINHKISAPFDQIDEYEADKYGLEIARKGGYDTSKFADFFKKLEKSEKRSLFQKLTSTHPFSRDRRECLENHLAR
ncbi:M48 family metallopeptidase [Arenibacter sp. GZD96]|uniref:M48 family metallopeptidase n=1 Tax=Aurantibrevibacter litoralis TaxID=3106030 RepID=UPI002AFE66F0|nr:M48 family metallopeptidase [Arenibacter sp. GZD-96]MEA1785142.1 M48 family metallopeptidase [Arenibacter sp. GZD-96]